jgi:hypothetical protein
MFDFLQSRIAETIASWTGHEAVSGVLGGSPLVEILSAAGIDPSMLEGMGPDQVLEFMAQHGIDVSHVVPEQLSALLDSQGLSAHLAAWSGEQK